MHTSAILLLGECEEFTLWHHYAYVSDEPGPLFLVFLGKSGKNFRYVRYLLCI